VAAFPFESAGQTPLSMTTVAATTAGDDDVDLTNQKRGCPNTPLRSLTQPNLAWRGGWWSLPSPLHARGAERKNADTIAANAVLRSRSSPGTDAADRNSETAPKERPPTKRTSGCCCGLTRMPALGDWVVEGYLYVNVKIW
jgi:hypothetical protein